MSDEETRSEFLKLLDELDAALDQPPKAGYTSRGVIISVEDQCDAGAESEVVWHFNHAEIAFLRSALLAQG